MTKYYCNMNLLPAHDVFLNKVNNPAIWSRTESKLLTFTTELPDMAISYILNFTLQKYITR